MNTQVSTYGHYQQGLNGLFSWLKKAVKAVISVVSTVVQNPFAGTFSAIHDFFDGDGMFGGQDLGSIWGSSIYRVSEAFPDDLPLTGLDEANLDNWLYNSFTPWFEQLNAKIKNLSLTSPTIENFGVVYNEVYRFIYLLKWYTLWSQQNVEEGFTLNAVKTRLEFLKIQSKIVEEQIEDYIAQTGVTVTNSFKTISAGPQTFNGLGLELPQNFNLHTKVVDGVDGNVIQIPDPTPGTTQSNDASVTLTWKSIGLFVFGAAVTKILSNNN